MNNDGSNGKQEITMKLVMGGMNDGEIARWVGGGEPAVGE